jgi:hypothetical protein
VTAKHGMAASTPRSAPRSALIVSLASAATVFVLRLTPIFDPDYFWHLHTGRYIASHRTIPATDPFSHTFAGQPWKFVDWVADLFMYGLFLVGGHRLVLIAFSLLGAIAVGLAIGRARRAAGPVRSGSLLVVSALTVAAVMFRVTPRPQTLTLLFFALGLLVLERAREQPRWLYAFPPIVVLWQNVHGSALIGWSAIFAFAVSATFDRRWRHLAGRAWLSTAASAVSIFIAVRPLSRFLAGFDHVGDKRVASLFMEWAPLWTLRSFSAPVAALLALVLLSSSLSLLPAERRKEPFDRVLLAALMVLLSLGTMRFVPFAALATAPLALRTLDRHLDPCRAWIRTALATLLVSASVLLVGLQRKPIGLGIDHALFPEESAAFVARTDPSGPMYNDFHFGGYLMWTLGKRHPVFIDGRSMAVYGVQFVWDVALADDAALDRWLRRYDVTWAVAPTGKRTDWFQRRPGWSLVHFDDVSFVAIRDDAQRPELRALAYRRIHPASYWEDIEALARDPGSIPAALAEAERAVAAGPSSIGHVSLAAVCMAAGDLARADSEIAEAIRLHPEAIRGHRIKTMRCVQKGDLACACAEARIVIGLAPTNAYARKVVESLGCVP